MARLINLLQKVPQQTDSSSKEFQQGGIYVALSLALSIFIYLTLSLLSLLSISSNISLPLIDLLCITPKFKEKPDLFYEANDYPA